MTRKTRTPALALALALVLALSACGGGGGGGGGGADPVDGGGALDLSPAPAVFTAQGACDYVTSRGSCSAYTGTTAFGVTVMESACTTTGGTIVATCPAGGLVGTCTVPTPLALDRLHLYAPWTAANGPVMCMNGAWSAPNPPTETATATTVSCDDPWEGTCADTSGAMTPTMRLAVQRYCTGNENTLLAAPCPRTGRSGTCTTAPGDLVWRTRHYDPANLVADQATCAATGGLWTAG